jgi:putative ABC transport system permease protein
VLEGRALTASDTSSTEPVAVINRTMADRFWPAGSPLNRRVRLAAGPHSGSWIRIVGIVGDVRHVSLSRGPVPEMYRPYAQAPAEALTVALKTDTDPSALGAPARSVVRSLDPTLPVYDMRTMNERLAGSIAETRATALLLALTALLAVALAGIAVYGSIWYSVTQRIPEIGIRLALGATRRSVWSGIVARALTLSSIGAAIGTMAAVAAGPLLSQLLFDTAPTDAGTYVAVLSSVMLLTLTAALVPARRATRVDPMIALRYE